MKEGKEKRNKNLQKNSKISSIDIEKGKNKKNIFLHTPPSPVLRKNYKKDTEVKLVLPSNILLKTPQAPKFQFPRPEIPDYIHRQSLHSDTWKCDYCKFWGDVWFIVKHWCKGIEIGKIHLVELDPRIKKTELEIKVAEELRLKEIKAREWTCPQCDETTDRFYKKFHNECIPEAERTQQNDLESCPKCKELIDPYWQNVLPHSCSILSSSELIKK